MMQLITRSMENMMDKQASVFNLKITNACQV